MRIEKQKVKDFLVALSLSNLCFLKVWSHLFISIEEYYYVKSPPNSLDFIAILFNLFFFAAVFFIGIRKTRNFKAPLLIKTAYVLFLFLTLIVFDGVRRHFDVLYLPSLFGIFGKNGFVLLSIALLSLVCVLLLKKSKFIVRSLFVSYLLFSPFLLVTLFKTAVALTHPIHIEDSLNTSQPELNDSRKKLNKKIIWFIFDEWDMRLAFLERPPNLKLPELDGLKSQSLFATHAYPPSNATAISIPALTTGKLVSKVEREGPSTLLINFDGDQSSIDWKKTSNIFSKVNQLNLRSAIVGWVHPYSRIFEKYLSYCFWESSDYWRSIRSPNLLIRILDQIRFVTETSKFSVFGRTLEVEHHINEYENILKETKKVIVDPNYDFIFVHWPIPHATYIYDEEQKTFVLFQKSLSRGYFGNLALVDRTVGEIKKTLEDNKLWTSSTLIMSSDHWWRASTMYDGKTDHRVPFFIKLADQQEGLTYNDSFNTVLTSELILSIFEGKINTAEDAAKWLNENKSIKDSPYNKNTLMF